MVSYGAMRTKVAGSADEARALGVVFSSGVAGGGARLMPASTPEVTSRERDSVSVFRGERV